MPTAMLERAAAGLESSHLKFQRILPRPTRPPTSRRRHRHRAAHAHQATRLISETFKTPSNDREPLSSSPQSSSRAAPAPPFDFLFPQPTHALLRRQFPQPDPFDPYLQATRSPSAVRCSHSSAAVHSRDADHSLHHGSTFSSRSRWPAESVEPRSTYEHTDESPTHTVDIAQQTAEHDVQADFSEASHAASLPELLEDNEGRQFHDVWDAYVRLEPEKRDTFRPRVVEYLSKSKSVVETGRALTLVKQVALEQWDNGFLSAAVLLLLRSKQHSHAVEMFKKGLWLKDLRGGFEYLLLDTVNRQEWSTLLSLWLEYCKKLAEANPGANPDEALLEPITSLQSLGALYFSLERYLAKGEWRLERWMAVNKISRSALQILRRKFAHEALRQPCPPNQAKVILAFWRDHKLYERYLWRMFDRWYKKEISTGTARMLPTIYEDWFRLPDTKPSLDILRGIFKVHYPNGTTALEQLYKDWVRCWGDLNHWGYEKFLKYYAFHGNKEKVRDLWDRMQNRFPSAGSTRLFRSTMNVYAQTGDVDGARQELDRMMNEYNIFPDIGMWNMLLKSHVRAGDYDGAMSCFQSICETEQPDSFTYTHIMAMTSKMGDLDRTIKLFNQAQEGDITITKEICLALVVAYCQNGQLQEAESICLELAQGGVTSIAIWNTLLHYNGLHAHLEKCYELLRAMKNYNLDWDHETIGSLLQALVRVSQTSAAYQIARDALESNPHIFRPRHLAIVMLGAVRNGDRQTAENTMSLMEQAPFSAPFNAIVAYARSVLDQAPNTPRTSKLASQVVASLQQVAQSPHQNRIRLRQETQGLGQAIQLMVAFRDFARVEELLGLFVEIFPEYQDRKVLPQDVIASLMLAYQQDGSHGEVLELWRSVWPRIREQCSSKATGVVYAANQYEVTRLVFRLVQTCRATDDGEGLRQCVEDVTAAGFKLTGSTWNRVIRALADLGQWESAMYWCETILMPSWRGWNFVFSRLTPAERREQRNPQNLQAQEQTVISLQKEWLKRRRLATWSASVEHGLSRIEERCPLVLRALISSDYENIPETFSLPENVDLDVALTEILTPLSLEDLREMEKTLKRQMSRSAQLPPGGSLSVDEDVFRRSEGKERERALKEAEMEVIMTALRKRRQAYHAASASVKEESTADTTAEA